MKIRCVAVGLMGCGAVHVLILCSTRELLVVTAGIPVRSGLWFNIKMFTPTQLSRIIKLLIVAMEVDCFKEMVHYISVNIDYMLHIIPLKHIKSQADTFLTGTSHRLIEHRQQKGRLEPLESYGAEVQYIYIFNSTWVFASIAPLYSRPHCLNE